MVLKSSLKIEKKRATHTIINEDDIVVSGNQSVIIVVRISQCTSRMAIAFYIHNIVNLSILSSFLDRINSDRYCLYFETDDGKLQ